MNELLPEWTTCSVCSRPARFWCDMGSGECNKPLCAIHATQVLADAWFCPEHHAMGERLVAILEGR